MNEKVVYVLLHLGVPTNEIPPSRGHIIEANKTANSINIHIVRLPVIKESEVMTSPNQRYFIRFPWYRRNDNDAIRIAECVLYGVAISFGPFGNPDLSDPIAILPASVIRGQKEVSFEELVEIEKSKGYHERMFDFPTQAFGAAFISKFRVEVAWKAARALYHDQKLFEAARFLKDSQDNFFVWPGQIREAASDPGLTVKSGWEQSKFENALISTFKVIEAIIGDPPSNKTKFQRKLRSVGIDPNELVGYRDKKPICDVIREMSRERDKKSAHGSTSNREIAVANMLEYQACSRYVLIYALENYLGEELF
jgi:hypothetical protein